MEDPTSWQELGFVALNQGISFLYGQAVELLKGWRERSRSKGTEGSLTVAPAEGVDQGVLNGQLRTGPIDEIAVAEHCDELTSLTETLGAYIAGIREITPSDAELTATVEALRGLLELVYGQRIAFIGEHADLTGSPVDVNVTARRVAGELTVARIRSIRSAAQLKIRANIDDVAPGGHVVGLDTGSVGD
jgi:hypothetical protein